LVVAVLRPVRWLFLGAVASVLPACGAGLARGQQPAAASAAGPDRAAHDQHAVSTARGTHPVDLPEPGAASPGTHTAESPAAAPFLGLEDPSGSALAAFHAALRRAQAGEGQARVVVYGASHVASDLITGSIRQRLQKRFGEAGPGFVQIGKPWRWYRHAGISIEESRGLETFRIKARAPVDGVYGLAGVALDARPKKAALAVITTRANGGLTGHASRLELYYWKQPKGGRIHLSVDGRPAQRIDTSAKVAGPGYALIELPDGPHRIELRTSGAGPVRIFGAALERDVPGVIVDMLGIPGARARDHLHWDDAVYREHLSKRRPDLIVLAYGTNESGDDDVPIASYEARLTRVLQRVREVARDASCLLIGPSDRPLRNPDATFADRPLTTAIASSQRRIAAEFGCGFFDLQAFMGGPMSMLQWTVTDPPLATQDYVHFTALGYQRLADSLYSELLAGFEAELAPDLVAPVFPSVPPSPAAAPAPDHELPRAER
jgi:lysophospholipase L1-like esterase